MTLSFGEVSPNQRFGGRSPSMRDYKTGSIVLLQGVLADGFFKTFKPAKTTSVFVLEGRPDLSAGKGNSAALVKKGIVPTVICDNMAGFLFFKGLVKQVVLACQFADKSGALCDMGGLVLAVLAKHHNVPVQLAPAEHKARFLGNPEDILSFEGKRTAPKGVHGYVPLVEWVPKKYLI